MYGLKLHLTSDLNQTMLANKFSPANTHGAKVFQKLNDDMNGIFVADAEYVSEKLEREFYREHKRILFTCTVDNWGLRSFVIQSDNRICIMDWKI